jgi:hypothetical protein
MLLGLELFAETDVEPADDKEQHDNAQIDEVVHRLAAGSAGTLWTVTPFILHGDNVRCRVLLG